MTNAPSNTAKPNAVDSGGDKGGSDGSNAGVGGEDESSTEKEGDDSHLHEDQKSRTLKT